MAEATQVIGAKIIAVVDSLSKAIATSLEKAKLKFNVNKYECHHIVAKKDRRAALSRLILDGVDLDVENSENKIYVKYNLHKHLHTTAYHFGVFELLVFAKNNRKKVIMVLNTIKNLLYNENKVCP